MVYEYEFEAEYAEEQQRIANEQKAKLEEKRNWNESNPPIAEVLRSDGKTIGIWKNDGVITWRVKRSNGYNPEASNHVPSEVVSFLTKGPTA